MAESFLVEGVRSLQGRQLQAGATFIQSITDACLSLSDTHAPAAGKVAAQVRLDQAESLSSRSTLSLPIQRARHHGCGSGLNP